MARGGGGRPPGEATFEMTVGDPRIGPGEGAYRAVILPTSRGEIECRDYPAEDPSLAALFVGGSRGLPGSDLAPPNGPDVATSGPSRAVTRTCPGAPESSPLPRAAGPAFRPGGPGGSVHAKVGAGGREEKSSGRLGTPGGNPPVRTTSIVET